MNRQETGTKTYKYVSIYVVGSLLISRIKQGMLQALVSEQEKLVKNSIAQFIGIVGKHEFPCNTWPEILQFIHQLCTSDNMLDKEVSALMI